MEVDHLQRWTESEFFSQLQNDLNNKAYAEVAETILRWAEERGIREWRKKGSKQCAVFMAVIETKGERHECFSVAPSVTSRQHPHGFNGVEILFQRMAPPFNAGTELQRNLKKRLNSVKGIQLPDYEKKGGKRPNIPFSTLADPTTLN